MKKKEILGRLALLCTALIWGTSFVIMKSALDNIGAMWLLSIRFTGAALLLGLFGWKRIRAMSRRAAVGSVLMGLCLAAAYIVQTYGLVYTTPGKNAFLTNVYCVMVPFMAWAVYRRRPSAAHVLGALLCLAGIGFVSLGALEGFNIGDGLTLLCGVFYAGQIIVLEHYTGEADALSLSALQFAVAAAVCWIGALLFERAPTGLTDGDLLALAYLSVFCTALCFFLEAWGMQVTPGATAAVLMTLEAVFGVLTSILFYHEVMTPRLVLGFVLIFAAVLLTELNPSFTRKRIKDTEEQDMPV